MSTETAEWLISQREARGWSRPQLARELIKAGRARGEKHLPDPDSLKGNIYRWEHGTGVSHDYVTLYCAVFGIEYREFPGKGAPGQSRRLAPPSPSAITRGYPQPTA
jgi:hypothetical protein